MGSQGKNVYDTDAKFCEENKLHYGEVKVANRYNEYKFPVAYVICQFYPSVISYVLIQGLFTVYL